ncbi:unnamed protein product [Brassica rapa subsp. trilocularis]
MPLMKQVRDEDSIRPLSFLADPGPQSKLTQNRSRTALKVKLITIKINMQTTR